MKLLFLVALVCCLSAVTHAKGNPQFTSLANVVALGQFIDKNMSEIVNSSVKLAQAQIPNSHYFLVTTKVEISGLNGSASITMEDGKLQCFRGISSKLDVDGQPVFTLSAAINCIQGN